MNENGVVLHLNKYGLILHMQASGTMASKMPAHCHLTRQLKEVYPHLDSAQWTRTIAAALARGPLDAPFVWRYTLGAHLYEARVAYLRPDTVLAVIGEVSHT